MLPRRGRTRSRPARVFVTAPRAALASRPRPRDLHAATRRRAAPSRQRQFACSGGRRTDERRSCRDAQQPAQSGWISLALRRPSSGSIIAVNGVAGLVAALGTLPGLVDRRTPMSAACLQPRARRRPGRAGGARLAGRAALRADRPAARSRSSSRLRTGTARRCAA